ANALRQRGENMHLHCVVPSKVNEHVSRRLQRLLHGASDKSTGVRQAERLAEVTSGVLARDGSGEGEFARRENLARDGRASPTSPPSHTDRNRHGDPPSSRLEQTTPNEADCSTRRRAHFNQPRLVGRIAPVIARKKHRSGDEKRSFLRSSSSEI